MTESKAVRYMNMTEKHKVHYKSVSVSSASGLVEQATRDKESIVFVLMDCSFQPQESVA